MYKIGDKVRILSKEEIKQRFEIVESPDGSFYVKELQTIYLNMLSYLGTERVVKFVAEESGNVILDRYMFAPQLIESAENTTVNLSLTRPEHAPRDIIHGATVGELREYLEQFSDSTIIVVTVPYHIGVYGIKATFDFD